MRKSIKLPSQFQINDKVLFEISQPESNIFRTLRATVIGVHFYSGKVKYDLDIPVYDELSTRIYNIDSVFVKKDIEK